jgi:hypothetical protein
VVAGLLLSCVLGAAALAAGTQVLGDDLGPVGGGKFLETYVLRRASADERMSVGCPDVSDPFRLAGQRDQIILPPVARSQDGDPTQLARLPAAHLQCHRTARCQSERAEQHTQTVEPSIPSRPGNGTQSKSRVKTESPAIRTRSRRRKNATCPGVCPRHWDRLPIRQARGTIADVVSACDVAEGHPRRRAILPPRQQALDWPDQPAPIGSAYSG